MNKLAIIFFTLTSILITSCKKNNTTASTAYTPSCSGTAASYSATVGPLIMSSCSGSGCHSAGSGAGCGPLTNYTQIKNNSSAVRSSIVNGNMPKGASLSTDQKNQIVCWIDAGANNN